MITINFERHPDGQSATSAWAQIGDKLYTSDVIRPDGKSGFMTIKFQEGNKYRLYRALLNDGYDGTPIRVIEQPSGKRVMGGILKWGVLPDGFLPRKRESEDYALWQSQKPE